MSTKHAKTKHASASANQKIANLIAIATSSPPLTFEHDKSLSRLYELVVLTNILNTFIKAAPTHRKARVITTNAGILNIPGSPCKARKSKHSHFKLEENGAPAHEAWVSVEVTTLSWKHLAASGSPIRAARHEFDVALFSTLSAKPHYPSFEQLHLGVSCKYRPASKEFVREALGLRRETGFLHPHNGSLADWMRADIPSHPPSPIFLASSTPGVLNYASPVDQLGLYMRYIPFPP